jgi:mannose-6-phosphate isomerase-like protein (cupin superfamily)
MKNAEKPASNGFHVSLEDETVNNKDYRRVIYTSTHCQLVLMSLKPGEEIGEETHGSNDQFIRFDAGEGEVIINGKKYSVKNGDAVIIPAGCKHNVINSGEENLQLYTVYSPAHHKKGTIHKTKADQTEEEFDGETDL